MAAINDEWSESTNFAFDEQLRVVRKIHDFTNVSKVEESSPMISMVKNTIDH